MYKNIISNLTNESPDDVLVSELSLTIRKQDLLTLESEERLNNNIIKFFMDLLIKRGNRKEFPNIHVMSIFLSEIPR